MTYTGVDFSLKIGFKKIVLTQELNLVLYLVSSTDTSHMSLFNHSKTVIARDQKFFEKNITFPLCHVSHVTCQMSHVMCPIFFKKILKW